MNHTRRGILRKASALSALVVGASATASAADCSAAPDWDSATLYASGDQVQHPDTDGVDALWEAALDSRNAEPSRSSAYWDYVGDCDGGGGGGNTAPTASFTTSISNPSPGENVDFDASGSSDSDGSISSYDWDFGDGATATGQTTSHSYSSSGDYTVTLTVTDDAGATDSASQTVSVSSSDSNTAPNASFTVSPSSPTTGESATFDAADSSDSDGSISSYSWEFGDGSSGSGQSVTHSYSSTGDYTVSLTVTDDDGATDSNSTTVTVQSSDGGGGGGPCDGVPQWESDVAYNGGDQVTYEGDLFTAEWWTKNDPPDDSKSVWTLEGACDGGGGGGGGDPIDKTLADVVPKPVDVTTGSGSYGITSSTTIVVEDGAQSVGNALADLLAPATGFDLTVETGSTAQSDAISLLLNGASSSVGDEGYDLSVDADGVTARANTATGLFWAVQSIRQVLPAAVEADSQQDVAWTVPGGSITDYPRFDHRGAMLDVARHFFDVDAVKTFVDQLAQYKINRLHLHLTDDQGWRIEIDGWPNLTDEGADSEVGGGPGGSFTVAEYEEIIQHAQDREMTVIPEIDMPGHTGAALESYAELNCDDTKREEDTGTNVGDTTLCLDADHEQTTYDFVQDVITAVASITDGPYLHVGGDEADVLSDAKYESFMDTVLPMVEDAGKTPIGWHQIADTDPVASALIQFWGTDGNAPAVETAANAGHQIVASPASRAYLDMDYNWQDGMGQDWAGRTSVKDAYTWDPGSFIDGVDESSIAGVEAPLWTEFIETTDDIEYMVFPRLSAIAELGWTPNADTDWTDFSDRLALQGPRWDWLGLNYYQSDQIDWQ